jgi:DNA polymerase III delta prime subunit
VDVISVGPDEKGTIGIDAARELKKFLWQTPLVSARRTAIIDSAEALTDEAQSALLKLVEEPSPHALLLFTTYEPSVLFPPLRSRLTKIYVPRLPKNAVRDFLVSQHGLPTKRAEELAAESFGRIGRALRLAGIADAAPIEGNELDTEIQANIFRLRANGIRKNARVLAWLVEREALAKRFNLNPNLQRKAVRIMVG